jgi:sugar lactone lactonase YvrE
MVLQTRNYGLAALALLFGLAASLQAQGILTVTPSRTIATSAGTGVLGYTGNGGAATSATVADPSGLAYDQSGNLYFADARNHVVREISSTGTITVIAGTGIQGYGGDGAAATSAYLDTPTGVAVDSSGNLYIADSHNHRIREISGGIITTIAGSGVPGFSGDGGAAAAAQLSLPSAVAVDASGSVFIADTNNQRIRRITGGTISTIAGDGEQFFSGDGGAATAAALDTPTGIAVDSSGNLYIADRHNQRIRMIAGATIATIAGNGTASFAGSFSGDGASAIAATLAKPRGIAVDALGNIYIADTDNQRIRQLGGGVIATIIGSGQQGYGADGATPVSVNLNAPMAVAPDALGNLSIADKLNQRVRGAALPALTFPNQQVGVLSAIQTVTLANVGSASMSVADVTYSGAFATAPGGTCSALPITLPANASCTEDIAFLPTTTGPFTGAVIFGGAGVVPQSILLAGTGTQLSQTATTISLASNVAGPLVGQAITLTATVTPAGAGTATGTISFYDGALLLGTAQTLLANSASVTTTTLLAGPHNLTAVYSGDTNFSSSTSMVLVQQVVGFSLTLGTGNSGGTATQTVAPGQTATFIFNLLPISGAISFPVTLSATGLPPGAVATFTPNPVTIGASPASFTMSVPIPATSGSMHRTSLFGGGTIAIGLLLLPFSRRFRRLRLPSLCAALLLGIAAIGGVTGCGAKSGHFSKIQQTYTIRVIATLTETGGITLQQSTTVKLTVE